MFFTRPVFSGRKAGVPADNARFVPDLAFTASWDHDPYYIILNGQFWGSGGSSAATPFFAGIVALLKSMLS